MSGLNISFGLIASEDELAAWNRQANSKVAKGIARANRVRKLPNVEQYTIEFDSRSCLNKMYKGSRNISFISCFLNKCSYIADYKIYKHEKIF